ncbi:MAG: hypothetical protein AAGH15_15260, partial [Myxococcota bacterium]
MLALTFAGAAMTEGWTARGARITWETWLGDDWVPIQWTTETSAEIESSRRPLSRVTQGWSFDRYGVPEDMPRVRAIIETRIEVRQKGHLGLEVEGGDAAWVSLDGQPVTSRERARGPLLEPGERLVKLRFEGTLAAEPLALRLELCPPRSDAGCRDLDEGDFFLPGGRDPSKRVWHWGVALLFGLLLASLAGHAARRPSPRRRRALEATALALIVASGVGLRLVDYDVMPDFRENGDELFATWNGWSILQSGDTRGWSLWPGAYGNRVEVEKLTYFGQEWYVIQPYFEHPPLLHVLVGAAAHAGGAEHWAHAKLKHTRLVPIALQGLSLVLIFLLGRRLDPLGPAPLFASFLYAFLPTAVLQGRAIKEEALLVPLALAALIAWTGAERTAGRGFWAKLTVAAMVAGLCTLTKVTGIALVFAVALLALRARGLGAGLWALTAGLGVSALLMLYGTLIDWGTFVYAQGQQGVRGMHFNVFTRFFADSLINMNLVGRSYVVFLWIAFAASHARASPKTRLVLAAPLVIYLAGIALGSGDWTYGWYAMPLHALLCVGAGRYLAGLWHRPELLGGALVTLLLVFYGISFTLAPEAMQVPGMWVRTRLLALGIAAA